MSIKKLAGQTAIYGISSIVGRALYFLLTPIYTNIFPTEEYGIVTGLFAFMGFIMVVFTYRMELAYFRFGAEEKKHSFNTAFSSIIISTLILGSLFLLFSSPLANVLGYPNHQDLLAMSAAIIALDALNEIPFARLRLEERPLRFALIRLTGIGINLGLNLFFIVLCPFFFKQEGWEFLKSVIAPFYDENYGIGYIFISNLVASGVTFLLLLPGLKGFRFHINWDLWKRMLAYALPMIAVGFSFVINEMLDRQLLPLLGSGSLEENQSELGVYGANYKLAMILALFTQAFRYGAEPFFFKQKNDANATKVYALIAKYFTIIGVIGFLGIMLFLDYFKYFIGPEYWGGLHVVPILLMANLFLGLYYNLSVWYKIKDKTRLGAYISIGGAIITIGLNILWIPRLGYTGSAWATLICYGAMTIASYWWGRRYYPIPYPVLRIFLYLVLALGLWGVSLLLRTEILWQDTLINVVLMGVSFVVVYMLEGKELRRLVF